MTALIVTGSLIAAFVAGWVLGGLAAVLWAGFTLQKSRARPFRPAAYWGATWS